jgi:peptidoglycan hydrolase CwlO-like protein
MTKEQIQDWIKEYNNMIDKLAKVKADKEDDLNKLYWEVMEKESEITSIKERINESYNRILELRRLLTLHEKEDNKNE